MVPGLLPPRLPVPRAARGALSGALLALLGACSGPELAREPPQLATLEEPLALAEEPQDEAQRQELSLGGFTGVYVSDARASLEAMLDEPGGLLIERVVENSPGAAAGLLEGDLLLSSARRPADAGVPGTAARVELRWPSEWRQIELESVDGDRISVLYDRAGAELEGLITVARRIEPAARRKAERVHEDSRVGVVLRSATEVEARAAGLGPGAGAVVVGLSKDSPWRAAGVHFEDLIVAADGRPIGHPLALVDAIRSAPEDERLELEIVRGTERLELSVGLSRREQELKHVRVPLIYSFSRDRDLSETSVLLGLFRVRVTPAAWDVRLLWLISFGGGDADRLVEVDS